MQPTVFAGNNITYTINFVNNGPSDAQTVTVTDAVAVCPEQTALAPQAVSFGVTTSVLKIGAGETVIAAVPNVVNATQAAATTTSQSIF